MNALEAVDVEPEPVDVEQLMPVWAMYPEAWPAIAEAYGVDPHAPLRHLRAVTT